MPRSSTLCKTNCQGHSLTGVRKNCNIQHCLVSMIENWKNRLGKGEFIVAIFVYLSKTFDTLNQNLLIAKLGAYGF